MTRNVQEVDLEGTCKSPDRGSDRGLWALMGVSGNKEAGQPKES